SISVGSMRMKSEKLNKAWVEAVNAEVKRILKRAKKVQLRLNEVLQSQDWLEEARKYAEQQRKEVRKLIETDLEKLRAFLERERKELERFQKQIPGEVKKLRGFVLKQRKELETLLQGLRKAGSSKKAARPKRKKQPAKPRKGSKS